MEGPVRLVCTCLLGNLAEEHNAPKKSVNDDYKLPKSGLKGTRNTTEVAEGHEMPKGCLRRSPNIAVDTMEGTEEYNTMEMCLDDTLNTIAADILTVLDLSGQSLTEFPSSEGLDNLLELRLSNNQLTDLPSCLKSSTQLRVLDLSSNMFTSTPPLLSNSFHVLGVLDLSANPVKTIPEPACAQYLTQLKARNCQLTLFPKWILFKRHQIEVLDLSVNPIFDRFAVGDCVIPTTSSRSLHKLNLSNTNLTDRILPFLLNFDQLETLDLSNHSATHSNYVTSLDKLPPRLKVLKGADVALSANPDLTTLPCLEQINLAKNPLSWLNPDFSSITLTTVVLPNCYICSLPENVGDMVNLEYLNLSYNDVPSLPPSFVSLERLKHLDLYQNSFTSLPSEITALPLLSCLDICSNYFQPPEYPLGEDRPSYSQLQAALRSSVPISRSYGITSNGWSTIRRDQSVHSSSSGCNLDDSEEESSSSPSSGVVPCRAPSVGQEEDWDIETNDIYSDLGQQQLNRHADAPHFDFDPNQFYAQYLHLVPERIRNSPLFYHRIDQSTVSRHTESATFDNSVVDGQFDDD